MQQHDIEANKKLARQFIENINRHDYAAMDRLLHPSFVWNTAVTSDDGPNELRKMQSNTMQGRNLHHAKPRLNREESMAIYKRLFEGHYGSSMAGPSQGAGEAAVPFHDDKYRMRVDVLGLTAEEDRIAMEAESHVLNPTNGRLYNNFYHYLFRVRDGKITLFKEYQDTLHLFDYMAE
ncbi:MAG: nuclear transport factor 2 family protein [Rhodospirillaceae bacterium]|nr:MAG: nuclear transport factor 2 family protein [Rhodospirillaceae bacterium]